MFFMNVLMEVKLVVDILECVYGFKLEVAVACLSD